MTNRIHTQNQQTKKDTNLSTTSMQGMFQPRPFVVQTQRANQLQQPDLETSLMQAKHYGHHLNQIDTSASKPEALQLKMEIAKPVQLAHGDQNEEKTTDYPASSSAVGNPTGLLPFSTLKHNGKRPTKPTDMKGKDSEGKPLTAHHKYGLSKLENDVSSASTPSTASDNIASWADPEKKKSSLTQKDITWSPHNIFMGPLSNNRLDDPGKVPGEKYPDLDTHFTRSGSVTPNSHVALQIAQGGGLANHNHADLVKKLEKLKNPSQPSSYNASEWNQSQPGMYEQAGKPAGWHEWDIDERVKYSEDKSKAKW